AGAAPPGHGLPRGAPGRLRAGGGAEPLLQYGGRDGAGVRAGAARGVRDGGGAAGGAALTSPSATAAHRRERREPGAAACAVRCAAGRHLPLWTVALAGDAAVGAAGA